MTRPVLQIGVDLRCDLFDVHPGWRVSDSDVRNQSFLFAETSFVQRSDHSKHSTGSQCG